jgi:hypothetical protein
MSASPTVACHTGSDKLPNPDNQNSGVFDMKFAHETAIGFAALTVVLLSGCTPANKPIPGFAGEPESPGTQLPVQGYAEQKDAALPAGVRAFAADGQFTVVTTGSSSCPLVADLAAIDQERETVTVNLTRAGGPDCTADLAPRTFLFEVAHDLSKFSVEVRNLSSER